MTATEITDALGVTREAVIRAWGKSYIRRDEEPDDDLYRAGFHSIGIDDDRAIGFLLAGWKVLREQRADAPGEQAVNGAKVEQASDPQWTLIRKLAAEKQTEPPDAALTKAQATQVIDQLKAGTYKPEQWAVPF